MFELQQQGPATYILPRQGAMKVPGLIIATAALLRHYEGDKPLEQVRNVAHLPGIVGYSIAMPDMHWGYGFPIGGVAATDAADGGVISPGGVGYDINCGVRLALAPLRWDSLDDRARQALLQRVFHLVPAGVGHGHRQRGKLSDADYKALLEEGAHWSVRHGFGTAADLEHIESHGLIEGAALEAVSPLARQRGADQLGSIGSGNHFIEIGEVEQIFLPAVAREWGMTQGQLYVFIHSGSRGFGHQVCTDTLETFVRRGFAQGLPDKQLVAAPIDSAEGQRYFAAMAAAANYAFNNRQQILHYVRQAFHEVLKLPPADLRLLYDVCHNIAKFENHKVAGRVRRLCVHRKGATRAFGPGVAELAPRFQKTGQPVLVPGDMGRASFVMAGVHDPLQGDSLTWCSSCHGAGRARSRIQSKKAWQGRDPKEYMLQQGVAVLASSYATIVEEMPDAYKDAAEVVDACRLAGLGQLVARLRPRLVVKG